MIGRVEWLPCKAAWVHSKLGRSARILKGDGCIWSFHRACAYHHHHHPAPAWTTTHSGPNVHCDSHQTRTLAMCEGSYPQGQSFMCMAADHVTAALGPSIQARQAWGASRSLELGLGLPGSLPHPKALCRNRSCLSPSESRRSGAAFLSAPLQAPATMMPINPCMCLGAAHRAAATLPSMTCGGWT